MVSFVAAAGAASLLVLGGWSDEEGNGRIKEEVREVEAFHGVEVGGDVEADIRVGPERKVTVTADDNLLPKIRTRVVDGVLTLEYRDIDPTRPILLVVVTPKLDSIEANGAVRMKVRTAATPKFTVEGNGAAQFEIQGLDVEALTVDLSGAARARFAGKAKSADLDLSGGVSLLAADLVVGNAQLDASGAVEAKLNVTGTLSGDASGTVKVKVKGQPKIALERSGFVSVATE